MGAWQRTALMIKESRGEEGLGSAGKSGQRGESGRAREEKVMCALWAKESQGEHGDNAVTGIGWGGCGWRQR